MIPDGVGVLRIQTPNSGSLTAKLFGPFWFGLECPRHVMIFNTYNIRLYLEKEGFHILSLRTIENNADFLKSCVFVWNALFKTNYCADNMEWLIENEILKLLFAPYCLFVNFFQIGDVMEVIATKV